MRPDAEAHETDAHRRRDHRRIAEHCLPRKHGDDFRDESETRNDEDVDLGMAEDPEEMHPHHDRAARVGIEEMPADVAVDHQHDLGGRERADRDEHESAHHQVHPGEERHAAERHALAAHRENRGDEIHGSADAADARYQQRESPVVRAVAGRKGRRRERRVGEPSDVGRAASLRNRASGENAAVQEEPAEGRHPEAESIQARKRHVARADHQRNEIVSEAEEDRHGDEKDAGRAVQREQTVEGLGREKRGIRVRQLNAHKNRFDSHNDEKQQRVDDVHDPDLLVVDGGEPFVDHAQRVLVQRQWYGFGSHYFIEALSSISFFRSSSAASRDTPRSDPAPGP